MTKLNDHLHLSIRASLYILLNIGFNVCKIALDIHG